MGGCPCKKIEKGPNYINNQNNNTTQNLINNQSQPNFIQTNQPYTNCQDYPNINNNYKEQNEYDYYKNNYLSQSNNKKDDCGTPIKYNQENMYFTNIYINQNKNIPPINNNTQLKAKSNILELEQRFKNIKNNYKLYYKDISAQNECITNYKNFINELNQQLNNFHDQLNISVFGQKLDENLININGNKKLLEELENLSYKINFRITE